MGCRLLAFCYCSRWIVSCAPWCTSSAVWKEARGRRLMAAQRSATRIDGSATNQKLLLQQQQPPLQLHFHCTNCTLHTAQQGICDCYCSPQCCTNCTSALTEFLIYGQLHAALLCCTIQGAWDSLRGGRSKGLFTYYVSRERGGRANADDC